jgi:hypothetical protein
MRIRQAFRTFGCLYEWLRQQSLPRARLPELGLNFGDAFAGARRQVRIELRDDSASGIPSTVFDAMAASVTEDVVAFGRLPV